MYNNVKKSLDLYIEKYRTKIFDQNINDNDNVHIYYNEKVFPIKKYELDLINEGLKKNLNKKK